MAVRFEPQVVRLRVNGDERVAAVPAHHTLLETLRYALGLTGSKQGCDKGDCGACTVLLDGVPVLGCITPVWEAEGREVTTVEGLADAAGPHPLQDAFDRFGAAQCGFCTPGILCSAAALLEEDPGADRAAVKEALSGNLCRCTGYTKILDAVVAAGEEIRRRREAVPEGKGPTPAAGEDGEAPGPASSPGGTPPRSPGPSLPPSPGG